SMPSLRVYCNPSKFRTTHFSTGNGSGGTISEGAAAVTSAINRGAHVLNNSISTAENSPTFRSAYADAYKANRVAVAAMGNQSGEIMRYPAAFGQGITAVGATTNQDVRASYSNFGNWIDMTAPSGPDFVYGNDSTDVFTTVPGSGYNDVFSAGNPISGTSFATPIVSGIAALLLSYNSSLYNDDVEQIIRLGVVDLGDPGFDNLYGAGRVDALAALNRLRSPYTVYQPSASGGTDHSSTGQFTMTFYSTPGLSDGVYLVKRHEVRKTITFSVTYPETPTVWGRGVGTSGYLSSNPNFGMGFCEVVPGTLTATGVTLRTYVYEVWTYPMQQWVGWKPTTPASVNFNYTINGKSAVTITGPTILPWKQEGTWTANPSGGSGAYTYEWSFRNAGDPNWTVVLSATTAHYTRAMLPNDMELQVKVTSLGQSVYDTHYVQEGITKEAPQSNEENLPLPVVFSLAQNYPNPFNPQTLIRFGLPEGMTVQLEIFDLVGRQVRKLIDMPMPAGYHEIIWNGKDKAGSDVPSGVYLYQISAGNFQDWKKLALVR
ncbi:MAG: S8 family serine peptidase, partial [bacterium]